MNQKSAERILDLDDRSTWHPHFFELVEEKEVWTRVEEAAKSTFGGPTEFCNQLTYAEASINDKCVLALRHRALSTLVERYSSVMAYHGCRPTNLSSYTENGVLPSDLEVEATLARNYFEGFVGLEPAIQAVLTRDYIEQNHGKVWLYFSGTCARQEAVHTHGGEFLRSVASRLGTKGEKRFEETGEPTLIQCVLPIEWLGNEAHSSAKSQYACKVLSAVVRGKLEEGEEKPDFRGGFWITPGYRRPTFERSRD